MCAYRRRPRVGTSASQLAISTAGHTIDAAIVLLAPFASLNALSPLASMLRIRGNTGRGVQQRTEDALHRHAALLGRHVGGVTDVGMLLEVVALQRLRLKLPGLDIGVTRRRPARFLVDLGL